MTHAELKQAAMNYLAKALTGETIPVPDVIHAAIAITLTPDPTV